MKVVDQPSLEFHNDILSPCLRIAIRSIPIGLVVDQNELYNFLGDGEMALKYQLRAKQLDPFLPADCRELEAVAIISSDNTQTRLRSRHSCRGRRALRPLTASQHTCTQARP